MAARATRDPQTFGVLLRRYRVAAGLTQEALAEQAGLSVRGLSDLERGVRRLPYRDTVQRLARALGLPEAEYAALLTASRRVGLSRTTGHGATKNCLPVPLTSFVGRHQELTDLPRLLGTTRLLTLTGAGGIGKTRLALEVARRAGAAYADGVTLVDLAALTDPALVPQAVASALDVQEQPGRPLREMVVDVLRSRQLLLVLDNCEHLVQACAELADTLLCACQEVRILATSRQPLRIGGEVAWRVPSLAVPSPQLGSFEAVSQSEAAQLFVERARAALPSFALTERNAPVVAQICRRLDGIPLALELAAARVPALSVVQLADRLDACFHLLTEGSRAALPRQQTLRGALDWSYSLLADRERRLFERLSVFAGGWTLEAAEAVCTDEEIPQADVVELSVHLVDQSLVVAENEDGAQRYRLLETIRQYAAERLEARGEAQTIRHRHADYFTAWAEAAEPELLGPAQRDWLAQLEQEHDNLRAVLAWSQAATAEPAADERHGLGLRMATALAMLWHIRGYWHEGRLWLEAALATNGRAPERLRAKALNAAGWLAWDQGDYSRAEVLSGEALTLSRKLGDLWSIAWSAGRLSHVRWMQGRYEEAAALATEALALFRHLELPWYTGWALHQLGRIAHAQGDEQRASELFEESLAHFRVAGDQGFGAAFQFANLGDIARSRGDHGQAMRLYEQALSRLQELGFKQGLVHTLHSLAEVSRAQGATMRAVELHREALILCRDLGDMHGIAVSLEALAEMAQAHHRFKRAARLFATAAALRGTVGCPLPPAYSVTHEQNIAAIRAELGESTFEVLWSEGRAMTTGEAVTYALGDPAAG